MSLLVNRLLILCMIVGLSGSIIGRAEPGEGATEIADMAAGSGSWASARSIRQASQNKDSFGRWTLRTKATEACESVPGWFHGSDVYLLASNAYDKSLFLEIGAYKKLLQFAAPLAVFFTSGAATQAALWLI